jgi:transcriptional regulator with XRE-family HTH domain
MAKRTTVLTSFGENIRRARIAQSLSQEELAARCGLHRTYVGAVERGERNIGLLNVIAIARALGISPSVLMEGLG